MATDAPAAYDPELHCETFETIYGNGKALCENLFDNSYKYVPTSSPSYADAYTMWFFGSNPNYNVSERINATVGYKMRSFDVCHLQVYNVFGQVEFKSTPSDNPVMTECQPFQSNACCPANEYQSTAQIDSLNGAEYSWNRCGQLSDACQEACFYGCDPNVGLWMLYPNATFVDNSHPSYVYESYTPAHDAWQIYNMPIQGDYCDAWYAACKYDNFCSNGGGSFFACTMTQSPVTSAQPSLSPTPKPTSVDPLSSGAVAGITIGALALAFFAVLALVLILREKKGKPVFEPKAAADEPHDGGLGYTSGGVHDGPLGQGLDNNNGLAQEVRKTAPIDGAASRRAGAEDMHEVEVV